MLFIALIVAASLALLLLLPVYEHLLYRLKSYQYGKSTQKLVKPVQVSWSFPLGLPWIVGVVHSMRTNNLPRKIQHDIVSTGVLTGRAQVLGRFSFFTVDPANIKAILSTQFKEFGLGDRYGQFLPLLGAGIFTLDGSGWAHSRAMLRPQFSREQVSHVKTIEVHVQKLITKLKQYPIQASSSSSSSSLKKTDEKFLDLQQVFFELTIDTATEFLFGESVGLLSGGNPRIAQAVEFGKAFHRAQETLAQRVSAQRFYGLVNGKAFQDQCTICKSFTDSYVQLALNKIKDGKKENAKEQRYVFLDELAKETQDPTILRAQSLNILLAGRDTTASLLSWVFYLLALHKPVFHKLRTEVLASFGTDTKAITFESLKRCTYLRYVIDETLRLYPIVPSNFRVALQDTMLPHGSDGASPVFVGKGSVVLYSAYTLHRLEKFWGPDAAQFRPERWAEPGIHAAHTWEYLPFNGGPRICLGQQFALTETAYTVVRILQSFSDIKGKEGHFVNDPPLKASLTMSVGNGVPLQFQVAEKR